MVATALIAAAVAMWKLWQPSPTFVSSLLETVSLKLPVPLWLCIIGLIPLLAWVGFGIRRLMTPAYERKFGEAMLDGVVWKWRYQDHVPQRPIPYCASPKSGTGICKTELILQHDPGALQSNFRCPSCNMVVQTIVGTPILLTRNTKRSRQTWKTVVGESASRCTRTF